jgi:hypothetical protein
MGAIFAMVAAPHCTGCTGDLHPVRTVIRSNDRTCVSAHAESGRLSTARTAWGVW